MWHASVAFYEKGSAKPMDRVSESTRRVLIKTAKLLLSGVGQFPSAVEQMQVAIHYRRALTEKEYAALDPAWCAIPAVHDAGRGVILEENT